MIILFGILNLILIIFAIVSFLWTIIGIPLGIVFLIKKDKNTKKVIICFLGPVILILTFMAYPIVTTLSTNLGGNVLQNSFNGIKPLSSPVNIQVK